MTYISYINSPSSTHKIHLHNIWNHKMQYFTQYEKKEFYIDVSLSEKGGGGRYRSQVLWLWLCYPDFAISLLDWWGSFFNYIIFLVHCSFSVCLAGFRSWVGNSEESPGNGEGFGGLEDLNFLNLILYFTFCKLCYKNNENWRLVKGEGKFTGYLFFFFSF